MDGVKEQLVSAKPGSKENLLRMLGWFLLAVSLPFIFLLGIYILIVWFGIGYLIYIIYIRTNVEYEYVFLDGSLTITKILGQNIRKKILSCEVKDFDHISSLNNHTLQSYEQKNFTQVDCGSGREENHYYAFVSEADKKIYFIEPDQDLMEKIKYYNPRNTYLD